MRADFDFDFDDGRDGKPWDRVLFVLRIAAEALLVAGAVFILYLAFRGPSHRPPASPGPAAASPHSPYADGVEGSAGRGAGVRHPAAGSASQPPPATPSASPGTGAGQPADSLTAKAQGYLAGRRGRTEAAVYDLSAGRQWTVGPQAPQAAASVVDLEILQAVLNQRTTRRTVLSLTEQELSPPMIEQSEAGATTTLWGDAGGTRGMRAFDHKARLTRTSPSTCLRCPGFSGPGWALTGTTPQDQVTLLRQLARPSRVLDSNDQKYALFLLKNVMLSQRWGVSAGVPTGVTVALKSDALPLKAGDWQVNSVGWVSGGGRSYLMSVLSAGNPSQAYGIDTLNHLGAMVWRTLGPRRLAGAARRCAQPARPATPR